MWSFEVLHFYLLMDGEIRVRGNIYWARYCPSRDVGKEVSGFFSRSKGDSGCTTYCGFSFCFQDQVLRCNSLLSAACEKHDVAL
ncbi:MAG: hypothetical protein QOH70_2117 [Blastocatellia bacterium]|nr:hypothetical protein [Blastocatellia bacterium]